MMFRFLLLLDCKREISKIAEKNLNIRLPVSCALVKTGTEKEPDADLITSFEVDDC